MVKKVFLITLCGFVIIALAAFFRGRMFISDQVLVKRQFEQAAELLRRGRKEEGDSVVRIQRSVRNLVGDACLVNVPEVPLSGEHTPREVAALVIHARRNAGALTVSFHDLDVTFAGDGKAEAVATAEIRGANSEWAQDRMVREVRAALERVEDRWLFTSVEVVDVLRR